MFTSVNGEKGKIIKNNAFKIFELLRYKAAIIF